VSIRANISTRDRSLPCPPRLPLLDDPAVVVREFQAQEQVQSGFEAASRSLAEANKGFQALAAEMMNYSKAAFDDVIRTWEQLIGVRSLEQAMQIQSDYAKRVYENHMAELKKLGEMTVGMVRDASKPAEDASRKYR
jgi:hypothetical protein